MPRQVVFDFSMKGPSNPFSPVIWRCEVLKLVPDALFLPIHERFAESHGSRSDNLPILTGNIDLIRLIGSGPGKKVGPIDDRHDNLFPLQAFCLHLLKFMVILWYGLAYLHI